MSGSYGASPRLLFVCTANICRSAYAEVRARQMLGLDAGWAFFSAGVPGTVGREMDPPMVAQAVAQGRQAVLLSPTRVRADQLRTYLVQAQTQLASRQGQAASQSPQTQPSPA